MKRRNITDVGCCVNVAPYTEFTQFDIRDTNKTQKTADK